VWNVKDCSYNRYRGSRYSSSYWTSPLLESASSNELLVMVQLVANQEVACSSRLARVFLLGHTNIRLTETDGYSFSPRTLDLHLMINKPLLQPLDCILSLLFLKQHQFAALPCPALTSLFVSSLAVIPAYHPRPWHLTTPLYHDPLLVLPPPGHPSKAPFV
jgi:hypothetical protein